MLYNYCFVYCVAVPASMSRCNFMVESNFPLTILSCKKKKRKKEKGLCIWDKHTVHIFRKEREQMETARSHTCSGCGARMPAEDGHNQSVSCLGHSNAITAQEDPASCMNNFIMPACTREARCLLFKGKRPAISTRSSPAHPGEWKGWGRDDSQAAPLWWRKEHSYRGGRGAG